ncbi:MAG: hypothetical protein ABR936_11515 [Bacteroidota bacterium]
MKNYRNSRHPDGLVQYTIHTDGSFVQLSEDILRIFSQYHGTSLAFFDVVIRKEY